MAGHPAKGEKAEGRKSGVELEMAGVESLSLSLFHVQGCRTGVVDGWNEAGIIRLPEPEVRLSSGLEDEVWSESKSLKGRKFQKIRRRRAYVASHWRNLARPRRIALRLASQTHETLLNELTSATSPTECSPQGQGKVPEREHGL